MTKPLLLLLLHPLSSFFQLVSPLYWGEARGSSQAEKERIWSFQLANSLGFKCSTFGFRPPPFLEVQTTIFGGVGGEEKEEVMGEGPFVKVGTFSQPVKKERKKERKKVENFVAPRIFSPFWRPLDKWGWKMLFFSSSPRKSENVGKTTAITNVENVFQRKRASSQSINRPFHLLAIQIRRLSWWEKSHLGNRELVGSVWEIFSLPLPPPISSHRKHKQQQQNFFWWEMPPKEERELREDEDLEEKEEEEESGVVAVPDRFLGTWLGLLTGVIYYAICHLLVRVKSDRPNQTDDPVERLFSKARPLPKTHSCWKALTRAWPDRTLGHKAIWRLAFLRRPAQRKP